MSAWQLDIDSHGVAWLVFDTPGRSVNSFTREAMNELAECLDRVAQDERPGALVVTSAKKGSFVVGADVDEIARVADEEEAYELSRMGQRVFAKLDELPIPSVALIHGTCLGGGMELALACTYRLVTDDPATQLGLPEVNLGIIPGWGGTHRLPQLIGLPQALGLILTGKKTRGKKAYRIGLADGIVTEAFASGQVQAFLARVSSSAGSARIQARRRKVQGRLQRWLGALPPARSLMCRRAARAVIKKTNGHYPAPLEACRVVQSTFGRSQDRAFEVEARSLASLAVSPISRNLVQLFQATQMQKRLHQDGKDPRDLKRGAVVGAGAMGGGIAWALSHAGMDVRLKDISWDAVAAGTSSASAMFGAMVKRKRMTPAEMSLAMHRISGTLDYSGFERAQIVIEAVVEDMAVKKQVLAEIESAVTRDTIICTNTSSLDMKEMATALKHADRFVGLHFFNPVNRMQLVEIIPSRKTPIAVVTAVAEMVRRMGKTPIIVGECPGFLVNRILLPYIVESAWMFGEGVAAERIDGALTAFGMPMGPLELADEVGLDVGLKVARVLEDAYGSRMHVPESLGRVVEDGGYHGRKSGRGFYVYNNGHHKPNEDAARLGQSAAVDAPDLTDGDIVDRAVLIMVNEAARCLEEGVVEEPRALDLAMVYGTGFAPFRGGLLRYAEQRGLKEILTRLRELESRWGERFKPAPLLERAAMNGGRFYKDNEVRSVSCP